MEEVARFGEREDRFSEEGTAGLGKRVNGPR